MISKFLKLVKQNLTILKLKIGLCKKNQITKKSIELNQHWKVKGFQWVKNFEKNQLVIKRSLKNS